MRTILNSASVRLLSLLPPLLLLTSCLEDGPQKEPVRLFGYGVPNVLVISPDGRAFISGGSPHAVLRDIESGHARQAFKVGWIRTDPQYTAPQLSRVAALAFSPDGNRLLTADEQQTVQLWDANSGERLMILERHTNSVLAVAFSGDGSTVARASADGTVRLWDIGSGRVVATVAAHTNAVTSLSLAHDGKTLLTASVDDRVARLWDVERAELRQSFAAGESVRMAAFAPNQTEVVVVSPFRDEQAQVWVGRIQWFNPVTGEQLRAVALQGTPWNITSLTFSPDGSQLITLHEWDGSARLWDVASGELVNTLNHSGTVVSAAFTPDGSRLVTQTGWDHPGAWLWELATGKLQRRFEGYASAITAVAFSPNGDQVATAAGNPVAVWLWDAASGNLLRSFDQTNAVRSMAFSPDGRLLLTAGPARTAMTNTEVGAACLWDVASGHRRQVVEEELPVNAAAFSPDGKMVLTGCGSDESGKGYARLWWVETGEVLRTFTKPRLIPTTCVSFSADGAQVLSGHIGNLYWSIRNSYEGEANLWDAEDGSLIRTFTSPDSEGVASAVFSPDTTQVLLRAQYNSHVYNRETGHLVRTIPTDWGDARSLALYSPSGLQILTATLYWCTPCMGDTPAYEDAVILDAETGLVACGLPWGGPPAVLSPDGRQVLTGGSTGMAALWDIRNTFARLRFQPGVGGTQIAWDTGTLQYAPSVQGPWMDLPARSPFPLSTIGQQGYFRVKVE